MAKRVSRKTITIIAKLLDGYRLKKGYELVRRGRRRRVKTSYRKVRLF